MRTSVAVQLARGDMPGLARSLEQVASLRPPGFESWADLARRGAEAAAKGDRAAARLACDACHQTWREEYRKRYRDRPM
jgi:cytochrome c553